MSKYIIDLRPDCKVVQQICVSDDNVGVGARSVELFDALTDEYVKENFKDLLEGEYQRGLNDAWEAARKIADMWKTMDNDDLLETFGATAKIGESVIGTLFKKQTANEAMLELEAYEEKQKAEDEIKVGDEVIYNNTIKCLVVRPETDERYAVLIDGNGNHHHADHSECKKTGRHFDIASILEDMKHD